MPSVRGLFVFEGDHPMKNPLDSLAGTLVLGLFLTLALYWAVSILLRG